MANVPSNLEFMDAVEEQRKKKQAAPSPVLDGAIDQLQRQPAQDPKAEMLAQLAPSRAPAVQQEPTLEDHADTVVANSSPKDVKKATRNLDSIKAKIEAAPPEAQKDVYESEAAKLREKMSQPRSQMSKSDAISMGLLSALPMLIGGVLGGTEGAAIGGEQGTVMLNKMQAEKDEAYKSQQGVMGDRLKSLDAKSLKTLDQRGDMAKQQAKIDADAKEGAANRGKDLQVAKLHYEGMREEKNERKNRDRLDKFSKSVNPGLAPRGSPLGNAVMRKQRAEGVEALVAGYKSLDDIPPQQIYELAKAHDALVSGGVGTVSGTGHLVPKSALGDINAFKNYLSNNPGGTGQGAFVKSILESVAREKEVANKQSQKAIQQAARSYSNLKDEYPEEYQLIMQDAGLVEDPNAPAEKKQPTPEEAREILARRKAQK